MGALAEPTFSSTGWTNTPIEIVKYIIGNYMTTDLNQASLLPQVKCFMLVNGQFNNSPQILSNTIIGDLSDLIQPHLPDAQVACNIVYKKDEYGDEKAAYDIFITVSSTLFTSDVSSADLNFTAAVKGSFVDNFVYNYIEND